MMPWDSDITLWYSISRRYIVKSHLLQVWMCGGNIKVVPCSKVGHIERAETPYDFPGGVEASYLHNIGRVAEIWMDDFKRDFYQSLPEAQVCRRLKAHIMPVNLPYTDVCMTVYMSTVQKMHR